MPKKPTKGAARKTPRTSRKTGADQAPARVRQAVVHQDLSTLTKSLLKAITRRSPQLASPDPLPPGAVGPELLLAAADVQRLLTAAAMEGNQGMQVWGEDDSELLVHTDKVRVELDDGLVVITTPVFCDQTGDALIQVPFAVGGKEQPAGMVIATEERPRGPAQIVDLWGEALTAFAWRILMAVTTKIAFESGVDQDREGLIPASLTASREGLSILTMARHTFDRVIK
jgi:hypothetical protein